MEEEVQDWQSLCSDHIRGQLSRGLLAFGLIGIGESGFYLNLQITLAALNCAITGQQLFTVGSWQMGLSVVASTLMAFKRTFDAVIVIKNCTWALMEYKRHLDG